MKKEWKTNERKKKCYDHEMLQFGAVFALHESLSLHSVLHSFETITHSLSDDLVQKQIPKTSEHAQMLIPITSSFTEQLTNSCERIPNAHSKERRKKEKKNEEKQ